MTNTESDRPRVFSYTRFSSPEQSKGDSRRRQAELAAVYAAKRGWELDTQLTFHDLGVSAFRGTNRVTGALGGFLNAVLTGAVPAGSFLLIESIDRLSRQSAWDALPTLQAIINADITLVTLSPEREISRKTMADNPFLLMEVLIYMIRANEESSTKSRRVQAVWKTKRAEAPNKIMTAWCPTWLTLDKKAGTFTVKEDRAAVINRIFGETLLGCSPDAIAFAMNIEGVPLFGTDRRPAKHWHRSFVNRLLENESVIGTLTPHTITYVNGKMVRVPEPPVLDYYPAVVDPIVYQRVQSQRASANLPMRGKHAKAVREGRAKVSNIFGGGMARCGRCGGSLIRKSTGKGPKGGAYLVCSTAKAGAGCIYESVNYNHVEDAFLAAIPRLVARAPAGIKQHKTLDKEIETLESSIYGTDDALERLLDSLAASRSPAVERRIRDLETELESLKAQLASLYEQRADTAGPLVQSRLNDMLEASTAKPLNRAHMNALVRQNLSRIEMDFDSRLLTLTWKQGGEGRVQFGFGKK